MEEYAFPETPLCDGHPGMTLRDYFAAKAMPEAMREARRKVSRHREDCTDELRVYYKRIADHAATEAYRQADAMLEARNET